jgi:hypothetical protein
MGFSMASRARMESASIPTCNFRIRKVFLAQVSNPKISNAIPLPRAGAGLDKEWGRQHITRNFSRRGAVAQLGERYVRNKEFSK